MMAGLCPRRKPVVTGRCSATDPSQSCPERLGAVRRGEMKPDFNLGAWIFTDDSPRRRITVEMKISGLFDHDLDPYSWYVCPWCGEELCSVFVLQRPDAL